MAAHYEVDDVSISNSTWWHYNACRSLAYEIFVGYMMASDGAGVEAQRIASLLALNVLDTEPEAEFNAIVNLASTFCETPIALISLVDTDRQWFKSRIGLEASETPRNVSFCSHAIRNPNDAFVVTDASLDERFANNPLVTGEPHVRFYAGIPLVTRDGSAIGTLCAIDQVPRRITEQQLRALRVAADSVMLLLEKRSAEARLRLLELVAVHASDGVAIIEIDEHLCNTRFEYVNTAFTNLTGLALTDLPKSELGCMLADATRKKALLQSEFMDETTETVVDSSWVARKDGAVIEVEIRLSAVIARSGDYAKHVVTVVRDVSERRRVAEARARTESITLVNSQLQREIHERTRAEQQLSHAASHDALTGLPNRTLFNKHLELAIASYARGTDSRNAIVFIDLDRFKRVNDSLGHLMGDALLVGVARRLEMMMRPSDIVSRFAGDEFTVLLNNLRDESEAAIVVERLALSFKEPFQCGAINLFATASIGASMIQPTHATAEEALRDADRAMFVAKENGRARAQFFNGQLENRFAAINELEQSLFGAMQRSEFRLHYQPIVSLLSPSFSLHGFEALVRWRSPQGERSPATFIPAAEETGLIIPLGQWILNQACDRIGAWHPKYTGRFVPMPTVSVNVSAKQFVSPNFLEHVDQALSRTGVDPSFLALELTETTLMEDVDKGRAVIAALRQRGVKIYLDDFGTGYCSFGYLRKFAVDCLKIDRSFVSGDGVHETGEHLADPAIVRAILSLAESLKITTIAEGVETETQLRELVEMGCPAAQGYLFSRPLEDAGNVLERACAVQ